GIEIKRTIPSAANPSGYVSITMASPTKAAQTMRNNLFIYLDCSVLYIFRKVGARFIFGQEFAFFIEVFSDLRRYSRDQLVLALEFLCHDSSDPDDAFRRHH